jgi:hypothetical protein
MTHIILLMLQDAGLCGDPHDDVRGEVGRVDQLDGAPFFFTTK